MADSGLKPCPFCGRWAIVSKHTVHYQQQPKDHYGAHCVNTHCCGGRLGYFWLTERGAIRAWNKRDLGAKPKAGETNGEDA